MTDPRIVPCEHCGSEGRIYTTKSGHPNDPDSVDLGPCSACEGTGGEIIETEPVTLDDLCADGCQYAKDVAMPEHSCSGECQYRLAATSAKAVIERCEYCGREEGHNIVCVMNEVLELRAENERLRSELTKIAEFPGQISDAGWEMHGIANRALSSGERQDG